MNTKEILSLADRLFDEGKAREAVTYMEEQVKKAVDEGDWATELTLSNELMGYYRSISQMDTAWQYASRAQHLVMEHDIIGTVEGETTFLNIANVYRAAGDPRAAMDLYEKIEKKYEFNSLEVDYRPGGLYNNMMVTSLELGRPEDALTYGKKAIGILEQVADYADECATVCSNLAGVYLNGPSPSPDEAMAFLKKGEDIFLNQCAGSPHYSANLAMQAVVRYRTGEYEEALKLYEKTLTEIEAYYGKNVDYARIQRNIETVKKKIEQEKIPIRGDTDANRQKSIY